MLRLIVLFGAILTACSQELSTTLKISVKDYNLTTEIERYLSTTDASVENQVIERILKHKVSNEEIKSILRKEITHENVLGGYQKSLNSSHNGKKYSHALYFPKGEIPKSGVPLIVILHGMGGHGETTLPRWIPRLKNHFAILCPSYPMGAWWSANAEKLILDLIGQIKKNYPVDHNRVFLSGLSNGAIGAFWIGMNHPDRFAGIAPIAGGITERLMRFLVNLRNTPIYIIHGKSDPVFPVALLRRVNHILADMKYPAVYREHNETTSAHGGHFMPDSETKPLAEWLEKQNRKILPITIRMTREQNHLDPIYWANILKGNRLAALQMPGPERETLNIKDGKIATLFVTRKKNNRFEAAVENVLDYEIYVNKEMIDFDQPVRVTTQELRDIKGQMIAGKKKVSFNRKINPDPKVLLSGFKKRKDKDLLFDAVIKVSSETRYEMARSSEAKRITVK